eukprot:Nitzschia sp. Nitz4//scaffold172_size47551//47158//47525//NITZ4_007150-RA/size47551-snap-gene-0.70-mRNA-1//-1//CDS//3329538777//4430//frame0
MKLFASKYYVTTLDHLQHSRMFKSFFRVSRSRMEMMLQDFASSDNLFFKCCTRSTSGAANNKLGRSCLEARLLLPLKTLAFGVAHHTFIDTFQMSNAWNLSEPSTLFILECTFNNQQPRI